MPHGRALGIRDNVAFFQQVRAALAKPSLSEQKSAEEMAADIFAQAMPRQ